MKSLSEYIYEALITYKIKPTEYINEIDLNKQFNIYAFDNLYAKSEKLLKKFLKAKTSDNKLNIAFSDFYLHIYRDVYYYDNIGYISFKLLLSDSEIWPADNLWSKSCVMKGFFLIDSETTLFNDFILAFCNRFSEIIKTATYTAQLDEDKLTEHNEEQLSDIKTKWHPEEGLFTKSAEYIVSYLRKHSKDDTQAMRRLIFYINRAGDDVSNKTQLKKAVKLLKKE